MINPKSKICNLKFAHLQSASPPLITVITVSFYAGKTIENTILSVINQNYPNIEYLIIDGGSTDNTLDIIKKYENKINYWIREKDKGIYDAMNKGVSLAKGDYIIFLGADDTFTGNTVLEEAVNSIIENNYPDIWCGSLNLVDLQMGIYKGIKPNFYPTMPLPKLTLLHQALLAKRNILLEHRFDTSFKIAADYEFYYWCISEKKTILTYDLCIANFSIGGVSATKTIKAIGDKERAMRKYCACTHSTFRIILLRKFFKLYIKHVLNKLRVLYYLRIFSGWKKFFL